MKNKPLGTLEITLQPGDFYFGCSATRIKTVLGSCVSVTMWHPRLLIGGMCHYMLPNRPLRTGPLQGKFADEAFELFAQNVRQHQTRLSDYHIKLFGGGDMFPDDVFGKGVSICAKNIAAAEDFLQREKLNLVSNHVGSKGHRSIVFDIWNGNVWVRHQPLGTAGAGR